MNVHSAALETAHALVAAGLAESGRPLDAPPVLGIVLDGPDGIPGDVIPRLASVEPANGRPVGSPTESGGRLDGLSPSRGPQVPPEDLTPAREVEPAKQDRLKRALGLGGEFLIADQRTARRVGTFKPVAVLGDAPWHDLYAHLMAEIGWPALAASYAQLDLFQRLSARPRAPLDALLAEPGTPRASSCARLVDAVAAALDPSFEHRFHPGEAAPRLAALAAQAGNSDDSLVYPFAIPRLGRGGLPYIEPVAMWSALLGDLVLDTPASVISARFHRGLARVIAAMVDKVARDVDTVALVGSGFQNQLLQEDVARRLRASGFKVLGHTEKGQLPCASASRVGS